MTTYETFQDQISEMSLADIKKFIAQEIFDDGNICAQDIRDLAKEFPVLAEKIQGCNFSKKETWIEVACWWNTHDCIDTEWDEPFTIEEIEDGIISSAPRMSDEQINEARQKFVDEYRQKFYPESTALVLAPSTEIIPIASQEKSWVYFALVFLVSFIIVVVELTENFLTWVVVWAIPTLIQFSQKVYQAGKNTRSLYEQVKGMNYLFIQ